MTVSSARGRDAVSSGDATHPADSTASLSGSTDPDRIDRRRPHGPARAARSDPWKAYAWLVFLAVGIAAIVGYELIPAGIGEDAAYAAISLSGVVAIVVGVRAHRPAAPSAWYLMAASQLFWVSGDLVYSWLVDLSHLDVYPSPADGLYLAGYLVLGVGLLRLIRIHRRGRDLAELIDAATVTAGLGLLSWIILAGPTIASERHSPLTAAVSVAYPIADIVLVGLLIRLVTAVGERSAAFRILVLAVLLLVVGDTASSALGLYTSTDTRAFDWIWLASYLLWGVAALHPSMHLLTEPNSDEANRFGVKRFMAMVLATLIAPGTLAVQQVAGLDLTVWPVVVGAVAMFLLVVSRMALTIRQIVAANRQRELLREELVYQAAHDSLTQLPNRAQAMRLLTAALHRAQRSGAIIGVLFVDLDGFKAVNDTLGHLAGDEVLQKVARTLQAHVRPGDVVARLGGDEFVVVLEPLDVQASALVVAERLVDSLRPAIELSGNRQARIGASIGLAISQDGRVDPEGLLHEADVAVYRAKTGGRGRAEVFDEGLRAELAARAELEAAIARAIQRDEFVLYYQPVMEVQSGRIDGYEALIRWNHPERGLLAPLEFVPVAEASDLICELDAWVLRQAMNQLARWNDRPGWDRVNLGVNISGRHVARARILQDVRAALAESGVDPHQLVLEVTETILIDEPAAFAHMDELRHQGMLIGIDDFGTGYNSIARLESIPADVVKVDKRFVDVGSTSAKLLPLMIQSAHAFGLPVVAEGVETAAQLDVLRALGCELAQGYFVAAPMEASAVEQWLDARRRRSPQRVPT